MILTDDLIKPIRPEDPGISQNTCHASLSFPRVYISVFPLVLTVFSRIPAAKKLLL